MTTRSMLCSPMITFATEKLSTISNGQNEDTASLPPPGRAAAFGPRGLIFDRAAMITTFKKTAALVHH